LEGFEIELCTTIWFKDGRFANHNFFEFIVHNIIMRKRVLEQSIFIVQQKLGDSHLTLSDLKDKGKPEKRIV
jgi:hypothetical protein